ncbi:extracellular solute-binding protein [Actinomyces sp. 186855]|nr:extracellular solute-binding protein [Actinomyces sp. AC-20-1]MCL3789925.1 extracellular solute-binding protein [Actinomyces sp. 187325]MCL3792141.1 extracellular solute-binding protein [Actinomyces sp. 186855]MCL3793625.1 extracellular solute-binding protein [Actinomyces sp. 217892]
MSVVQEGSDTLEESLRAHLPAPASPPTGTAGAPPTAESEAAGPETTGPGTSAGGAAQVADPVTADLAVVPQPGLITELVRAGLVTEAPEVVAANTELGWEDVWARAGTVDGTLYAAPLMASVKSFVWYSPAAFARAGYEVPETWEDLLALTRQVVEDHPDGDVAPWCVGAADGATTGWPLSDWLEDALLATEGTTAYDAWAGHEVPLDDRRAVQALNALGQLLLAEGHVAGGGQGAVTTTVEQAGEQLVSGSCLMLHASSSFETLLPAGTVVTDGRDTRADGVSTFLLPSVDDGERAVLVGGDYLVALAHGSDAATAGAPSDARTAVMSYLTSAQWAAERVAMGGVASANRGARGVEASSPVAEAASDILQSRQSVIRFDASDMMPSQVGTRALWDALTGWAVGERTAADALGRADDAWPEER